MTGPSFRWFLLWFASLALLSCSGTDDPPDNEPGCTTACAANQVCTDKALCACAAGFLDCDGVASNGCEFQGSQCEAGCTAEADTDFCARNGKECGAFTGTDNCGEARTANCGGCPEGSTCGLSTANVCGTNEECVPESNAELCVKLGKNCGTVTTDDRCDESRTVECGACPEGDECGLNEPNVCGTPIPGCEPEHEKELCGRLGLDCGTVTAEDNCEQMRSVSCGTCGAGELCGAEVPNVCGPDTSCVAEENAEFCGRHGKNCGLFAGVDNCGGARTAVCGDCGEGERCGSEVPFVCGPAPCEPETAQQLCQAERKNCGNITATDRCGETRQASCGACLGGQICGSLEPNVCGPDTSCEPQDDAALCASMGMDCGTINAPDNCGNFRTVTCGTCAADERCGLYETNVCAACAETDEDFCFRNDKDCGNFTGTDLCGNQRTAQCGGCSVGSICQANSCVLTNGARLQNEQCFVSPGSFLTCAPGLTCIYNNVQNSPEFSGCKQICLSDSECMYGRCALGILSEGRGLCGDNLEVGDACGNFFANDGICTPFATVTCVDGFCEND